MSIERGPGYIMTVLDTELQCPICEQTFEAIEKIAKAKLDCFKMKCPVCKGKITVLLPLYSGPTKVCETNCPPNVKRLETETEFKINGIVPPKRKPYDDNSDEENELFA